MLDKARIMVVDDELPVCRSLTKVLEREGYEVEMVQSGEEAIEKSRAAPFEVVITDLMMPGMSGMDLLNLVRDEAPGTKVIVITGYPSVVSAVEALKLGAFDYIPKPFTPDELRSLVSRALASRTGSTGRGIEAPPDIYCIPETSWVRLEEDGSARVGIHHAFLDSIETIAGLELPRTGEMRYQGEACARVTGSDGHVHTVWTPLSGRVMKTNTAVLSDYSMLMEDPYGAGWLILIAPTNTGAEMPNLARITA